MSMGSLKEVEEKEEEKKEGGCEKKRRLREEGEDQKKNEGMKIAGAVQIIKLIILAAAVSSVKAAKNKKIKNDEEKINFETMVACFTFFVVLATLFAQQIWKVGVRLVRAAAQKRQVPSPGNLPGKAKRGEKISKGSAVSSHGERSIVVVPLVNSPSISLSFFPLPQVPIKNILRNTKGEKKRHYFELSPP